MARKPKRQRKAPPTPPPPRGTSDRDKAIDALMALLAEHSLEEIGLAEVAGRAGLKLSQLRAEFGSVMAILRRPHQGHRQPGAGRRRRRHERGDAARAPVRRADAPPGSDGALQGSGALVMHSARRNPPLGLALNAMAVRSQRWMLEAAGIPASGPRGALRAQGAALLFAQRAQGLGRRRRGRPRPHHGRARPRPRARRTLGRLPRRPLRHPRLHPARSAAAPPLSRRVEEEPEAA